METDSSGRVEEKLSEPAPSVKEKARDGLLAAKRDGTLDRIAADMEESNAGQNEEQPTAPAPTVQEKAREGLLAAQMDGTLERIVADMEQEEESAGSKNEKPEPAFTVNDKAREGLLAAKRDGTLDRIAQDMEKGNSGRKEEQPEQATEPALTAKEKAEAPAELPPLSSRLNTPRKHASAPRTVPKPPSEEEVFSEAALRKRAEQKLEMSARLAAMNMPSVTNYPHPLGGGLKNMHWEGLSEEAQQSYMRVARYEAEDWVRKERQRVMIEAKIVKRQNMLNEQLAQWYERRAKVEEEEKLREEEREREKEKQERLKHERWMKRREELHHQVAEWAANKGQREYEKSQADEAAAKEAEEKRKKKEAKRRQEQKDRLEEWYQKRAEQKLIDAEKRRLQQEEEEKLQAATMRSSKGQAARRRRGQRRRREGKSERPRASPATTVTAGSVEPRSNLPDEPSEVIEHEVANDIEDVDQ
eukprot:TRINITY_DN1584_c0_g1_i2.p1 TRINITY_DN1584_c0_g1~~TRINITY_DN1584_c0_g1_i2.p1  ORF type:complete len:481 (-),score=153.88 TRINITY_DN1584_c0_g1_i2:31-1449(-)